MKKIKKYILLILILVLTLSPLQTRANYTQPKFSVSNRVVRVGVFDSSGFWNLNGSTVMSGYAYDYLMAISNYTGWKYEFVSTTLSDAITMLQAGKIDVVMGFGVLKAKGQVEVKAADGKTQIVEGKGRFIEIDAQNIDLRCQQINIRKHVEHPDGSQRHHRSQHWHDGGQRHDTKTLPGVSPVHLSRFVQRFVDGLQNRQE